MTNLPRRNPERLLEQIEEEERRGKGGRLKVFLGYASGVGKSARMFKEGLRRRERGEDVVVAATQPKSSAEVTQLLSRHEVIPTLEVSGKEVIDLSRILNRRPQVVVIDGLAYDNPPGSRHAHRWQEIEELLEAGISVITSVNLHYIAELQDEVESITGKRRTETVPKAFLERADDIEVIDAPAGAHLARLRELALLVAAEVVEKELQAYLRTHQIDEIWGTQERILVGITPRSNARSILESGRRNADRFHGELFASYVRQPDLSPDDEAALEKNLEIARELGAQIEVLQGKDPVRALVTFAQKKGITQIFIGHSQRRGWWHRLRGNPVERLIELAEGIDVRVFPQKDPLMSRPESSRDGRLKVYLSYAAGAGKTYRMLEEGQQLKQQGIDVVIGYFESHRRRDTMAKAEGLETVPRKTVQYRDVTFEEMDTEAILRRAPAVCLVDEFAHTNVPGAERGKRWEDVLVLLDAGIEVWTTMNLQHLESLNDQVFQISGIQVRETVPDWVIKQANEVVMVDVTPEALINRLKRGVVYDADKAEMALANFFKEQTLTALRELAFRQAALEVDARQPEMTSRVADSASPGDPAHAADRILIHITSDPATAMLIRRGHRVAQYLRAECFAVYISRTLDLSDLASRERELVEQHLNFARTFRIETRILVGERLPETLVEFAHRQRITQLFLARSLLITSFPGLSGIWSRKSFG